MYLIVFSIIVSFAIIYFAVRLAISPLIHRSDDIDTFSQDTGLAKLRDIGILNDTQLEEVIELF